MGQNAIPKKKKPTSSAGLDSPKPKKKSAPNTQATTKKKKVQGAVPASPSKPSSKGKPRTSSSRTNLASPPKAISKKKEQVPLESNELPTPILTKPPSLRRAVSTETAAQRQSPTTIQADDLSGSFRGRKPPSTRGIGRFSSMPASLKPPVAGGGLKSIIENDNTIKTKSGDRLQVVGRNKKDGEVISSPTRVPSRSPGRGIPPRGVSTTHVGLSRPSPRTMNKRASTGTSMTPPPPPPIAKRHSAPQKNLATSRRSFSATPQSDTPPRDATRARDPSVRNIPSSSNTPGRQTSILRNSMHKERESHGTWPNASQRGTQAVNFGRTTAHSRDDDLEEVEINFEPKGTPIRKVSSHKTNSMDLSVHSFHSMKSVLSVDQRPFEDDPKWKQFLRWLRILPPHPNEKPEKKRARILTWAALTLDFIAAMVAVTTYNGVQTCCGVPIFSIAAANIDWNTAFRVLTYIYLLFIFVEIIPVVRNGIPFNVVNPIMGFTITFAMFFEDRVGEAVCMWIIEASAIFCEFLVYRIKSNVFHRREERLEKCDKDLKTCRKEKGNLNGSACGFSDFGGDDEDEDQDGDEDSFGGESFEGSDDRSHVHLREVRLLRERRILRQTQKADRVQLRYHFGGVVLGFSLVLVSLILIIFIARSGGLCIKAGSLKIFQLNQLEKCDKCTIEEVESKGVCEHCPEGGGGEQCYYPYYKTSSK